jgi:hypothetical protein
MWGQSLTTVHVMERDSLISSQAVGGGRGLNPTNCIAESAAPAPHTPPPSPPPPLLLGRAPPLRSSGAPPAKDNVDRMLPNMPSSLGGGGGGGAGEEPHESHPLIVSRLVGSVSWFGVEVMISRFVLHQCPDEASVEIGGK